MAVNEIEIPKTSETFRVLNFKFDSLEELFKEITEEYDQFSIDPEIPGFHDCDHDQQLIRGFLSMVVPFEVEHLTDGIATKTLMKRIETCEFFALENILFVTGKTGPQKILKHVLSSLTGYGIAAQEFEFRHLNQFQEHLSSIKNVKLTNPKDREVRRATLAGKMESYEEYNVIDPKNHGIESVAGLLDTPLGPITITVGRKGSIRLNVKRGFILTMDCLLWIVGMIRDEKPVMKSAEKLAGFCKENQCSMTATFPDGESVTVGKQ